MTTTPPAESPPPARRNSLSSDWTKEQEDLLKQWCEKAACYRWLHENAQAYFQRRHYIMTIPVIVLSTVAGTANFSLGSLVSSDSKEWYSMGIGAINLISGLIATLANFFRFAERMESHRSSGIQFSKFQRNISAELALSPAERENARDFVKLCRSEYDKLIEQSPPIPDKIIDWFNRDFEDDEDISKPDMCEGGITPTQIYGRINDRRVADIMAKAADRFRQGHARKHDNIRDEVRVDMSNNMIASINDSLERISHSRKLPEIPHIPSKLELKKRGLKYLNQEREEIPSKDTVPDIIVTDTTSGAGTASSGDTDDSIHSFITELVKANILLEPGTDRQMNMESIRVIEEFFRKWQRERVDKHREHLIDNLEKISRGETHT
jgi:hypothetical protein